MFKSKTLIIILIAVLFIFIGFFLSIKITKDNPKNIPVSQNIKLTPTINPSPSTLAVKEKAKVSFIYDGDTIELSDKRKIRYIGINTPEINWNKGNPQCFGKEAANFNRQLVEGQTVELEKDISETDKYGRLLRFVYIDDVFINDLLVRLGYAQVDTVPPDIKYAQQFLDAQHEAREGKRGLWRKCGKS